MAAGCSDHPEPPAQQLPQPEFVAANQALENHQPDQAIAQAKSFLTSFPSGPMAAQAWYLEGRGYEDRNQSAASPQDMEQNLVQAHSCYLQALGQSPPRELEGDIHASLSNVAFFQDDYSECIRQASMGIPLVDAPGVKSYLLYRIGVSQQRLGEFTDADQTFRQVKQRYPNTAMAEAAREHEGQRQFYVQLANYDTQDAAGHAVQILQSRQIVVGTRTDSSGHTFVDAGPYATFSQAKAVRDQVMANFPHALVVP